MFSHAAAQGRDPCTYVPERMLSSSQATRNAPFSSRRSTALPAWLMLDEENPPMTPRTSTRTLSPRTPMRTLTPLRLPMRTQQGQLEEMRALTTDRDATRRDALPGLSLRSTALTHRPPSQSQFYYVRPICGLEPQPLRACGAALCLYS